jgi:hypothetical protein
MNHNPKWVCREHSNGSQVFYQKQLITYWMSINWCGHSEKKKSGWYQNFWHTLFLSCNFPHFITEFTLQRGEAVEKQHMWIQSWYWLSLASTYLAILHYTHYTAIANQLYICRWGWIMVHPISLNTLNVESQQNSDN